MTNDAIDRSDEGAPDSQTRAERPSGGYPTGGLAAHRFGFATVGEGEKQGYVDAVFHRVAARYDLMNDLMSAGLHRVWKEALVSAVLPGKRYGRTPAVLDVAGGTGDVARRILERNPGPVDVTVVDINASMLAEGRARTRRDGHAERLAFVEANAEALPFPNRAFDVYAIAFGIRNVPHIEQALSEARRVLRRGGRIGVLEFSKVDVAGLDALYDWYSFNVIPRLGRLVVGDEEPYRYLVESIRAFPVRERFAKMMRNAGFSRVSYRSFSGGIVTLHTGWAI